MSISIGCEWDVHSACDPSAWNCGCICHQRKQPRLLRPPAPMVVRKVETEDAVEALLRRMKEMTG